MSLAPKPFATGDEGPRSLARQWLLAGAGVVFVGLALIGVVLPLLPTTPFLLLAAACFVRSSDRLYRWLTQHRLLGSYIRNYREHRGITRRAKIVTLVLLWAVAGFSAFTVVEAPLARAALLAVATAGSVYIRRLRTVPADAGGPQA